MSRRQLRQQYTTISLFLFISGVLALDERYDRIQCLSKVQNLLSNDANFASLNPKYFSLESTLKNPLLTLDGCNALCGSSWGPYPDDGPRLIDWIIPGILLIANMHFTPGGKRRYLMLIHTLGDPIDSMYRLLCTIETWNTNSILSEEFVQEQRILHKRQKRQKRNGKYKIHPNEITAILSSSARLLSSLSPNMFSAQLLSSLSLKNKIPEATLSYRTTKLKKTARNLRLQRTHDIRRTYLAILLYIIQITTVFVPIIGGSPSPSGGKVSPAMMLLWLLPIVLLSNAIGDYTSWQHSHETLLEFLHEVRIDPYRLRLPNRDVDRKKWNGNGNGKAREPFVTERACTGTVLHTTPFSSRKFGLGILAMMPVTLACLTAFLTDYTAPTYFSCRATSIYVSLFLWVFSFLLTQVLSSKLSSHRHLWLYVLVKDILISTPILILILISTCGWFNSCYCSSGVNFRGKEKAQVVLDPTGFFWENDHVIYPAAVSVGILIQLDVAGLVRGVLGRGFRCIWWSLRDSDEGMVERGLVEKRFVPEFSDTPRVEERTVRKPVPTVQVREIEMEGRFGSVSESSRQSSFARESAQGRAGRRYQLVEYFRRICSGTLS